MFTKQSAHRIFLCASVLALNIVLTAFAEEQAGAEVNAEVNVYSARQEHLIKPLLDDFSAQTGIKVNLLTGKGGALLTRLAAEGHNSPADVFITTDVAWLERAKQEKLSQATESDILQKVIPAIYRDAQHHWFGLSLRVRAIMMRKDAGTPDVALTYESLADVKCGLMCIVTSTIRLYRA